MVSQNIKKWLLFFKNLENVVLYSLYMIVGFSFLMSSAIFCYSVFYYIYIPEVKFEKDLHFLFSGKCYLNTKQEDSCSYPLANVTLYHDDENKALGYGQPYKVFILLNVPESQNNKNLGMFLIDLKLYGRGFIVGKQVQRSTLLIYKSELLEFLDTLLFSPLYLFHYKYQSQQLLTEMFENLVDDPYNPSVGAVVQIRNPNLHLYSAKIVIYAQFSGLRYFMFYYPLTAAVFGSSICFSFLSGALLVFILGRGMSSVSMFPNDSSQFSSTSEDADKSESEWPNPRPILLNKKGTSAENIGANSEIKKLN